MDELLELSDELDWGKNTNSLIEHSIESTGLCGIVTDHSEQLRLILTKQISKLSKVGISIMTVYFSRLEWCEIDYSEVQFIRVEYKVLDLSRVEQSKQTGFYIVWMFCLE